MVIIISDTTSSLPVQVARDLEIPYLPQIIMFGDQSFRDDTELDSPTFLKKLRQSRVLPKTAAPPPALYAPIFQEIINNHDSAIVITPSSDVSGTFRSATVAAQDFPGADIRIIDSRTVAGGMGTMVLKAHEWAKQGQSADEIEKNIRALIKREHVLFMVDTLEYLYKGGRIGGAQALFGSILQVKPILTLVDGHIEPVESQRTKKRAFQRLRELVLEKCPREGSDPMLSVFHIEAEADALMFADWFKKDYGVKEIPIYFCPPAIIVHAGPGVVAVSVFSPE
jgi:DegV family protein with EDD domain